MSEQGQRTERRQRRAAARRIAAERAAQQRRQRILIGAVVAIALVAAIALIALNRPEVSTDDIIVADPLPADIPVSGMTMGDPAAPVHLIEWGDYT